MRNNGMLIVVLVVIVTVAYLVGVRNRLKVGENPQQTSAVMRIDNPLTRGPSPTQEVGWATAENTSSGVLIQASVKVGFRNDDKGGAQ